MCIRDSFSEDEPVVAVQMRDMKKEISDLKEAQQTLFKIIDERLPEMGPKPVTSATNTFSGVLQKNTSAKGHPTLQVLKPYEKASHSGKPPKKRLNSAFDDSNETVDDDSDDGWESTREDKRKEKLRKRNEKKKEKKEEEKTLTRIA